MDRNSSYYSNTAYDFDMFAPKPEKKPASVVRYPVSESRKKVHTERNARTFAGRLAVGAMVLVIVGGVFANVFARAAVSQTEMQIDKQEKAIAKLDSEIVRLQCDVQAKLSYDALEAGAEALGMQKLERRQTTYVKMAENTDTNVDAAD